MLLLVTDGISDILTDKKLKKIIRKLVKLVKLIKKINKNK